MFSAQTISLSLVAALVLGAGCSEDSLPTPEQLIFGGDRPTPLFVPPDYDHAKKTPLLVVLHGYGAGSYLLLALTGLRDLHEEQDILVVAPEGVVGDDGAPSWNIEGTCCNRHDTNDVAYIAGLVEEISSVYNVDQDQIFVFGHSNGGTMAYHLACERPDLFSAIASLAGPTPVDSCNPSQPVSILHIHGSEDDQVDINGGNFSTGVAYPSASDGLDLWANFNGCGSDWQEGEPLDIEAELAGSETSVRTNSFCPSEIALEQWTIAGGAHNPGFQERFHTLLYTWLR